MSGEAFLLLSSVEIDCLNRRFPTACFAEGEDLLLPSKLERQGDERKGPVFNHGVVKAANKKRRKVLDGTGMFLPHLDFLYPVNSLCRECLESSDINDRLSIRKSTLKHIRKDFTVIDVVVRAKELWGEFSRDANISIWRYG